jgi:hypothetical protein
VEAVFQAKGSNVIVNPNNNSMNVPKIAIVGTLYVDAKLLKEVSHDERIAV